MIAPLQNSDSRRAGSPSSGIGWLTSDAAIRRSGRPTGPKSVRKKCPRGAIPIKPRGINHCLRLKIPRTTQSIPLISHFRHPKWLLGHPPTHRKATSLPSRDLSAFSVLDGLRQSNMDGMMAGMQLRPDLDSTSEVPLYRQLGGYVQRLINSGDLQPGDRLPPTR